MHGCMGKVFSINLRIDHTLTKIREEFCAYGKIQHVE